MFRESVTGITNEASAEKRKAEMSLIRRLLELHDLSRVKRWRGEGEEAFTTPEQVKKMKETVSEHQAAMQMIAEAVISYAETVGDEQLASLDYRKISQLIMIHDLEETVIGDARAKDEDYYKLEEAALAQILTKVRETFGPTADQLFTEYHAKTTDESRFVKVIDELQAWIYMLYSKGTWQSNRNFDEPETVKGYQHSEYFPVLRDIMNRVLEIWKKKALLKNVPDKNRDLEEFLAEAE